MKVSWQVTGIRQDAYALEHPLQVEQDKPANERGYYLNPVELGYPESRYLHANQQSGATRKARITRGKKSVER